MNSSVDDGKHNSLYVAIGVDTKKSSLDEKVLFKFSHGHDIYDNPESDIYIRDMFWKYIYDYDSSEKHVIYSKEYGGLNYFSEENRCDPGTSLTSTIEFNQPFELDIDFSRYDINNGAVFITLNQTEHTPIEVDGEETYEVINDVESKSIRFTTDDTSVVFSE